MGNKLISLINTSKFYNDKIYYRTIEDYINYRFKDITELTSSEINSIIKGLNCYVEKLNDLFNSKDKLYKVKFIATRAFCDNEVRNKILVYEEEDGHWDELKCFNINLILLNEVGLID